MPFAPFPAIAAIPLIALIGPVAADHAEPIINGLLAAATVGMCWWTVGRLGVSRLRDRAWLTILFGFSTQILWVTTRGGVWHTGQLIATLLTFGCLLELWGSRRAWLIGLLAGAAFLTRAPLAFAVPFYALLLIPAPALRPAETVGGYIRRSRPAIPWRAWAWLGVGRPAVDRLLLRLQPAPVRVDLRVRLRRWRACRRSSSSCATRGCSPSPTSR